METLNENPNNAIANPPQFLIHGQTRRRLKNQRSKGKYWLKHGYNRFLSDYDGYRETPPVEHVQMAEEIKKQAEQEVGDIDKLLCIPYSERANHPPMETLVAPYLGDDDDDTDLPSDYDPWDD